MLMIHLRYIYCTLGSLNSIFFFFNDTATTEIYTLSLHDALPISPHPRLPDGHEPGDQRLGRLHPQAPGTARSEEHTSELQSHLNLVCRLLLEKKKQKATRPKWSPDRLELRWHAAQSPSSVAITRA